MHSPLMVDAFGWFDHEEGREKVSMSRFKKIFSPMFSNISVKYCQRRVRNVAWSLNSRKFQGRFPIIYHYDITSSGVSNAVRLLRVCLCMCAYCSQLFELLHQLLLTKGQLLPTFLMEANLNWWFCNFYKCEMLQGFTNAVKRPVRIRDLLI